ncbi:hypothetical protein COMA2_180034 [Candidatus Nitrospira nitrificans]|uniref:Uncharacterized protein n=1 Tax=Candidatus Nitrospira nitrificans TaxID=1742973 RepID=A0A0S4LA29_9BACT|nr:hypothetical protein COMA2_180034 [Candidatus Nitrospira nitrificans]
MPPSTAPSRRSIAEPRATESSPPSQYGEAVRPETHRSVPARSGLWKPWLSRGVPPAVDGRLRETASQVPTVDVYLIALTAARQPTYFTNHLIRRRSGSDGESHLPNTESQRIQPNEVHIPDVFIRFEDPHGPHSDETVATLPRRVRRIRSGKREERLSTTGLVRRP